MVRKQTLVQLTEQQVAALDRRAIQQGVSRSALIREAVDGLLADDEDARVAAAIIEGYRRVPPGTPDEWGDIEAQMDVLTEDTLRRLEAEERAAGVEPW